MSNQKVVDDVVELIIDSVNLRHVDRSTITPKTELGPTGLGLDSVDILEVVVNVENEFGCRVTDKEMGEKVFRSIGTIAEFVESQASAAG